MRRLILIALTVPFVAVVFPVGALAQHEHAAEHNSDRHASHRQGLMEKVYKQYFLIRSSLANDSMTDVSAPARAIAKETDTYVKMHDEMEDVNILIAAVSAAAKSLAEKNEIAAARSSFGDLSKNLIDYQKTYVTNKSEKAHVFYCDMVKKSWLQETADIGNPYYGSSMLKCGKEIL